MSFSADLGAVSATGRGAKVVVFNAANCLADERMADHQLAAAPVSTFPLCMSIRVLQSPHACVVAVAGVRLRGSGSRKFSTSYYVFGRKDCQA